MKAAQVLTDESIEKIKKAIKVIEDFACLYPFDYARHNAGKTIADLKAIIADVES